MGKLLKCCFINICLLCVSLSATAGVFPLPGSALHYTSVYFEDQFVSGAATYELLVSNDSLFNRSSVPGGKREKKIPAFWVDDLDWGKTYYWRIRAFDRNAQLISNGKVYSFRIINIKSALFDTVKLKVLTNLEGQNAAGFIAFDNARSIYNRSGKAVWTIPNVDGLIEANSGIRDIKMTNEHTLTFLTQKLPIEMDLEGRVIWKGNYPLVIGRDTLSYHHDFRKDAAGNYWVLGNRFVFRKLLLKLADDVVKNEDKVLITDSGVYRGAEMSVLLKFDKHNKLLWMWDANKYIKDVDLNYKLSGSGFPNFSTHMNAFSLNASGTKAYVGFRDLSRVVKLDIKTGKVELTYGEKYPSGDARYANNAFRSQHDANVTPHNSILVFNNNTLSREPSTVLELKDNPGPKDSVVLWDFNLKFDTLTKGKSVKGGNVTELPNGNLLVCAGDLNRTFEVTRKKQVVWDAFCYMRKANDTVWRSLPQYRASFIEKLNRYHFLLRTETLAQGKQSQIQAVIYNTGNCSDKYLMKVMNESGKLIWQSATVKLQQDSDYKLIIPLMGAGNSSGKLTVHLVSLSSLHTLKQSLIVN